MYYLSRVEIDTNNRQKMQDLTHVGRYHGWIESCFPYHEERRRHLWRIDRANGRNYVLILSDEMPDLGKLEKYGVSGTAQVKTYAPKLSEDGMYRFKLTANPIHRNGHEVYAYNKVSDQMKWGNQQLSKHGFMIKSFDITGRGSVMLEHEDKGKRRRVYLRQATYEGIVMIDDLDKAVKTLYDGIGREKAYGMGMLTLMPVR